MEGKEGEGDLLDLKTYYRDIKNSVKAACSWSMDRQMGQNRWHIKI